jgi:hypothetical protein
VTYEIRDYAGVVAAVEPGNTFHLPRLTLRVDGREEPFVFNPIYGRLLFEKVKVGSRVIVKATINSKGREIPSNNVSLVSKSLHLNPAVISKVKKFLETKKKQGTKTME